MGDFKITCCKCKKEVDLGQSYEYRGAESCGECFDQVCEDRDRERNEIIIAEDVKTKGICNLELGDNPIGKENRKLLAGKIEVASKESERLKRYEGRS